MSTCEWECRREDRHRNMYLKVTYILNTTMLAKRKRTGRVYLQNPFQATFEPTLILFWNYHLSKSRDTSTRFGWKVYYYWEGFFSCSHRHNVFRCWENLSDILRDQHQNRTYHRLSRVKQPDRQLLLYL